MNKIKILSIAAIAAAATVMTSCSKSNEVANESERVEVRFASNMAQALTRVDGANWAVNDRIGIYMLTGDYSLTLANISEGVSNREYQAAAAGAGVDFTQVGGLIYYPVSGDVKFIAYYPYGTVTDGSTTFTRAIDLSNQTDQSAIDYLYAVTTAAYTKTSGTVNLPFVHKLVKLDFTIENDASVTTPLSGGMTVTVSNQATTGTMNLTGGSVAASNSGQTITLTATANGTKAEAIVFPAADNTSVTLTFKNSAGEEFSAGVPAPAQGWEGSKKYAYTVRLKRTPPLFRVRLPTGYQAQTIQVLMQNKKELITHN